jgi:hypothetical protein
LTLRIIFIPNNYNPCPTLSFLIITLNTSFCFLTPHISHLTSTLNIIPHCSRSDLFLFNYCTVKREARNSQYINKDMSQEAIAKHCQEAIAKHCQEAIAKHCQEAIAKHCQEAIPKHCQEAIAKHCQEAIPKHCQEAIAKHCQKR